MLVSDDYSGYIFDKLPLGAALLRLDRTFIRANEALAAILGYTTDELVARACADITHPDDVAIDADEAARMAAGEIDQYKVVKRFVHKAGHLVWGSIHAKLIRDQQGDPAYYLALMQDVTEHKDASDLLLAQEHEQRLIAESLREAVAALASSLDRATVINTIFQQLERLIPYDGAAIYLKRRGMLVIAEARGELADYIGRRVSLSGIGLPQKAYKSRQPQVVYHTASDARFTLGTDRQLNDAEAESDDRSWLGAPLAHGSKVLGVVTVCHSDPQAYSPKDLQLLQSFTQHAATALVNARLYEQAYLLAADEERNRLARELHDSVTQALFSVGLIADVLPRLYEENRAQAEEGLVTLRRLAYGALAEMRTLLLELRPSDLHNSRLDTIIGHLSTATTLQVPVEVVVSLDPTPPLPSKVQLALYRITQEALTNAIKHAKARNVEVILRATPLGEGTGPPSGNGAVRSTEYGARTTRISIQISDDGVGFNEAQVLEGSLGLGIMSERAKSIKASLQIESKPGKGTTVSVTWEGATVVMGKSSRFPVPESKDGVGSNRVAILNRSLRQGQTLNRD
jgi:PAS domain S-box-containing protein